MGQIKKEVRHRIIREDLLGGLSFAKGVLETTARYVPTTVLFAYTLKRLVEPISQAKNPWDETRLRLLSIQTPILTLLALMYQGPLGALGTTLAGLLTTFIAPFRFAKNPDGTHQLDMLDAAFAAGMLPLILGVLTAEPKEKARLI